MSPFRSAGFARGGSDRRLVAATVLACAAACTPPCVAEGGGGEAAPGAGGAGDAPCTAELIAETTSLRPGTTATLGVRFTLRKDWHLYWRNPGDSGIAPTVAWTLPAGFAAGEPRWPLPRRIESDGSVTFGYEGSVLLPVEVRVPRDAKGDVALAAKVKWLACHEECVPGRANLTLTLPVRDEAPAADPEHAGAFAAARERLPAALPAGAATLTAADGAIVLTVDAKDAVAGDVRSVAFFPSEQLVLDSSRPAALDSADGARLRVRLTPYARRKEPVARLQGVLAVTTARRTVSFEIDAALPRPAKEK